MRDIYQVTGPSTTFPIIMRWFLIQIALNIGNVVKPNHFVRTNVGDCVACRVRQGKLQSALTFPIIMRWFLIQIALNIGTTNSVKYWNWPLVLMRT